MCHAHYRRGKGNSVTYQSNEEFQYRSDFADLMGKVMVAHIYSLPGFSWKHSGVEHTTTKAQRALLRGRTDPEALAIRLKPDKDVVYDPFGALWAEEKFMQKKLSGSNWLRDTIRGEASPLADVSDFELSDSGYIELLPWRHYERLARACEPMAVVLYVAWHPARILMDWIRPEEQFLMKYCPPPGSTDGGSDEPIARIHLKRFKTLAQFLEQDLTADLGALQALAVARAMYEMDAHFASYHGDFREQFGGTAAEQFNAPSGPHWDNWARGADKRAASWKRMKRENGN